MTSVVSDREPRASFYEANVDRVTAYLESLPQRARSVWIDAAYQVYLHESLGGKNVAADESAET